MTLLRLENVGKSYGGVAALRGLSFAVDPGEIVGLMGANGAGKTTAFSLIAGTQRPSDGEIWFDGARIDGQPRLCGGANGHCPYISDRASLWRVAGDRQSGGRRAVWPCARAIAKCRGGSRAGNSGEVGLARDAARLARNAHACRSKAPGRLPAPLATGPRLLLLDEVLAGLTASEVVEALDLIRAIHRRRNLTLVVIEHVMRALTQLCNRIVVLHHGEKITEGSPAEILADQRVIDLYLGATKRERASRRAQSSCRVW